LLLAVRGHRVVAFVPNFFARLGHSTRDLVHFEKLTMLSPNKPDAVSLAMALWFAIEDRWRRVTDLERSAARPKVVLARSKAEA
jgi:hypothetical protein